MTRERWQRVKDLFERALDQPPDARSVFLKHTGETPSVLNEVEKLLDVDAQGGSFLQDAGIPESSVGPVSPDDLVSGQFRIVSVLGRGGMGVVYRAEDLTLSRPVALKFVPGHVAGSSHGIERLKREARAAAALNHPNICVVYETGEHQGQPFIVMELLEGVTLKNRIAGGPLDIGELLDWALQIVSGMEAAHQAGIVHRDIKPGNIFITAKGQAKILDFGLAKVVRPAARAIGASEGSGEADLTGPGMAIGTVSYMSPEQALGEELDTRTDLFSFGAVLYEMATGRQAFARSTSGIAYEAILTPTLPGALGLIIAKALEKDRDLRYQHAADLRADLQRMRDEARQLPVPRKARVGRRIWISAFAIAAALALSGVVARWVWLRRVVSGDHHEIVFAGFESSESDPEFANALNTAMGIDLGQSPFLVVAPHSKIVAGLKLMERPPQEKLTPAVAREVCQRINDQAVLSGIIARLGQKYLITLTASDCATGADLAQSKAVAKDRDGVLIAVDSVAEDMRRHLGEPLKSLQRFNKPLLPKQTGSLDALKAYSRAHDLGVNAEYEKSIPFFRRAIELDPRFAVAYADLGAVYSNLGESDLAAANCKQAYELREFSDEPDRLFIIAKYHEQVTGNLLESIRNDQAWTETYPAHAEPWENLAGLEILIGRPDLALAPAAQARLLAPRDPVSWANLAVAQMHCGQIDNALATCRQAVAQGLDSTHIHELLAELAFARRDFAALNGEIAWAKGKSAEPDITLYEALMLFGQGKRRAALETLGASIEEYEKQGMPERANRMQGLIPRTEAELGFIDDARNLLHRLPPIEGSTDVPVAMAEVGEESQAEEILRRNLPKYPEDTVWQYMRGPQIQAAIALSQLKADKAIEALRPGIPYDLRNYDLPAMRGRAYLAARQPELAIAEFHKIVDNPGVAPHSYDLPLAHLGLARALALQGNPAAAKDEYEKFFALWKDADADIPVLRAARLESARIRR